MRHLTVNDSFSCNVTNRSKYSRRLIYSESGFSFVEIAIALIIIGMLSGAGFLILGKVVESTKRKETLQSLLEMKRALLFYAENKGKLPAETNYFQYIGSSPLDGWQKSVTYKVSQNILHDDTPAGKLNVCRKTKNPDGYTGWTPTAWIALDDQIKGVNYSADGTGGRAVVALLLSSGARDADGDDSSLFDGDNATGFPNPYARKYPVENFDDIVVSITADEMYGAIRENFCIADVTVIDDRAIGDIYYVYNVSTGKDVGSANGGDDVAARVPFDSVLVIRDVSEDVLYIAGTELNSNAPPTITVDPTLITLSDSP